MTMTMLNAVAHFQRDLLVERAQAGLKRAKSEGKAFSRPSPLSGKQKQDVHDDVIAGMRVSAIVRKFATSWRTISRVRNEVLQYIRLKLLR